MLFHIKFWADYARFTRSEARAEPLTYSVPPPTALVGGLESIYWKPEMRWVIRRYKILKPIQIVEYSMNHLSRGGNSSYCIEDVRVQRKGSLLKDVAYLVEAEIQVAGNESTNNLKKHCGVAGDRFDAGKCFKQPYLGIRECSCYFERGDWDEQPAVGAPRQQNFGFLPLHMGYQPAQKGAVKFKSRVTKQWSDCKIAPIFFEAIANEDAVIEVPSYQPMEV